MLVIYLKEANSFTLDRNVATLMDVDDSQETSTTMDLPDSMESTQNQTLKEDDIVSLEDDRLTDGDNVPLVASVTPAADVSHVAISTETQQVVAQFNVHVRNEFLWDDLVKDLDKVDVSDNNQSRTQAAHVTVDQDDSLEDVLEKLVVQKNVEVPTSSEPASVESRTLDGDDSVEDMKIIQVQTSTVSQIPQMASVSPVFQDDDDDDFSWEDYAPFINPDALQLTTMNFHHLPATLFTHPTSDDWFLMRHYMDDHFVWELGDELAKEYFWQPIKATSNMKLGSTVQVSAGHTAQLTPA